MAQPGVSSVTWSMKIKKHLTQKILHKCEKGSKVLITLKIIKQGSHYKRRIFLNLIITLTMHKKL